MEVRLRWNGSPIDTVTVLTEQEISWISEVAGRLRLIQADTVAAAPEQRREYLMEEVARNLETVAPAQRKRYLEALLSRFPVAGQIIEPAPAATSPPIPEPVSADQLLAQLLVVASELPQEKRNQLSKRLAAAGLAPAPPGAPTLEIPEELRKALGLGAGLQPRLDRLAQLGGILIEMVHRLNDRAVDTMRDLFPKNPLLERPPDFRLAATQFLTGESESVDAQVRMVSSFLGSLLVALQGGGKDFGRHYLEKYSPSAILEVVESEKQFGLLPWQQTKHECCWSKYVDLAKEISTPDLIDRKIKERLAAFVKQWGLGGQPPS